MTDWRVVADVVDWFEMPVVTSRGVVARGDFNTLMSVLDVMGNDRVQSGREA